MRDFLDPIPGSCGDAQVLQQSLKSAGDDRRFSPEGLHLVSISVHLLGLGIARGRVLFINLLVFRVMVPQLLLLLSQRVLSRWALRNHQLYLKRFPLLVMPLGVRLAGTLEVAAHSEVPADRRVDDRCFCVRCGGYEPSII
jgi:hypothetical protein